MKIAEALYPRKGKDHRTDADRDASEASFTALSIKVGLLTIIVEIATIKVHMESSALETALERLGQYIATYGEAYGIVVTGDAAVNLLGFVSRVTSDVDVLAMVGTQGVTEPPPQWPSIRGDGIGASHWTWDCRRTG